MPWRRTGLSVLGAIAVSVADGASIAVVKPDAWEGVHYYRDFAYGPRKDIPGEEGEGCTSGLTGRDDCGRLYNSHRSGQFFDVMVDARGVRPDAPIYLNIHGGAWCCACDKNGENMWFLRRLAQKGFVVVNMNYQLQTDVLDEKRELVRREHATFSDMLADIDAIVTHLKRDFLPRFGVKAARFAIGGTSAGAHLSLLYAYDQGNPSHLGLALRHDLKVAFAVDVVGPTNLASEDMMDLFVRANRPLGFLFSPQMTHRFSHLFGWLTADDLNARMTCGDVEGVKAVLSRYSPAKMVTADCVPTILAYCRLSKDADTDGCVPVSAYRDLKEALERAGVPLAAELRSGLKHGWLGADYERWLADRMGEFAQRYLGPCDMTQR